MEATAPPALVSYKNTEAGAKGEMNLLQKWFASISHETCLRFSMRKHIYEAKTTCNPIYSKIIKNTQEI